MKKETETRGSVCIGPGRPQIILGLSFFTGGLLACCFLGVYGKSGHDSLVQYLVDYMMLCQNAGPTPGIWTLLWNELRYGIAAVLLSWTAFSGIGHSFLFLIRGFFLTFLSGVFLLAFGIIGIFPVFVFVLLPALFWLPALFILGTWGIRGRGYSQRKKDGGSMLAPLDERIFFVGSIVLLYGAGICLEYVVSVWFFPYFANYLL